MARDEKADQNLVQDTLLRAYRFFGHLADGTRLRGLAVPYPWRRVLQQLHRSRAQACRPTEAESWPANLEQFVGGGADDGRDIETALFGRLVPADVEKALTAVPSDFRMAAISPTWKTSRTRRSPRLWTARRTRS